MIDAPTTHSTGTVERETALGRRGGAAPMRVGTDQNDDMQAFLANCRAMTVVPHVAQNTDHRRSAINGQTTQHPSYAAKQIIRKRIEEVLG